MTNRYSKEVNVKSEIELWMYNTFKHPSILPVEITRGKFVSHLTMPLGQELSINMSDDEFGKVFSTLLNVVVFMYKNGVIYGDIKLENMIKYKDDYYLIDMDLVYFHNLKYTNVTQTFAPVRGEDNPYRRMIYALGYFVYRWKTKPNLRRYDDYLRSVKMPPVLDKYDKWTPLILEAMENDKATLDDLILLSPVKIGRIEGIAEYSKTPNYPKTWDGTLDAHNRTLRNIIKIFTEHVYMYSLSMELYWRYYDLVKKNFKQKSKGSYDDVAKCIFLSAFKLVASIENIGVGIGQLSFHAMIECDLLKEVELEFMKTLAFKLPSLFRDAYYKPNDITDSVEDMIYQIANPLNITYLFRNVKNNILTKDVISKISDNAYKSYIKQI